MDELGGVRQGVAGTKKSTGLFFGKVQDCSGRGSSGDEGMEGSQNSGNPGQKTVVEIQTTEEALELDLCSRSRKVSDGSHTFWERADANSRDFVPKEGDGGKAKLALLAVDGEAIVGQPL